MCEQSKLQTFTVRNGLQIGNVRVHRCEQIAEVAHVCADPCHRCAAGCAQSEPRVPESGRKSSGDMEGTVRKCKV